MKSHARGNSLRSQRTCRFGTPAECNDWLRHWYGGKPAAADVHGPFGKPVERAGRVRHGSSIRERHASIAIRKSVMDDNSYLTRRWNQIIGLIGG